MLVESVTIVRNLDRILLERKSHKLGLSRIHCNTVLVALFQQFVEVCLQSNTVGIPVYLAKQHNIISELKTESVTCSRHCSVTCSVTLKLFTAMIKSKGSNTDL